MSKKVFIAEQETLLEVQEQVEKLVRNLVPDDAPIYGMVIHEASDLNPSTRVEYLGANKDFTPMSMNMSTHAMNYGSWAGWDWLKANVPVMCNWDGGIDYFLDPDDYTKKADGTNSDAANIDYAGDAMAIVKKIYKKEYKVGNDRYVYFCERKVDDDFHAVGFNVLGKERDYMLIPMFYGSIDSNGKMRSIAGQWSCLTASGSAADNATGKAIGTAEQYTAIQAASSKALFFGGALTNTLADICILLSKSTDSQTAFGSGMANGWITSHSNFVAIDGVCSGALWGGTKDDLYTITTPAYTDTDMMVEYAKLMKEWDNIGVWKTDVLNNTASSNRDDYRIGRVAAPHTDLDRSLQCNSVKYDLSG